MPYLIYEKKKIPAEAGVDFQAYYLTSYPVYDGLRRPIVRQAIGST